MIIVIINQQIRKIILHQVILIIKDQVGVPEMATKTIIKVIRLMIREMALIKTRRIIKVSIQVNIFHISLGL